MTHFNEKQIEALRALCNEWKHRVTEPEWSEYTAARNDALQEAAEELEALLSGDLFEDDRPYRVAYTRPGEKVPYLSKPLAKVDAEALADVYRKQGLPTELLPVEATDE